MKQRQQETAQSGTHNSGEVQLDSSQRNRGGELFLTNDVRDNGSPNRSAKRKSNPEREDASKHRIRVDHACPRPKSKERCACSLPQHSTHDHNAPVHDVSESAGWEREQEEWHGGSRCHEGERKRGSTKIMHQPRRSQVLDRDDRARQQARQP